jgi:mannose-1-phosphate guanylyltransferase
MKKANTTIIPVVLSGGAGSRLWPVSREGHPKPFLRLSDGQSLLQETCLRAAVIAQDALIITVTNRDYYFTSKDEWSDAGIAVTHDSIFMLGPVARNTAPAVALAARYVAHTYGGEYAIPREIE